MRLYPTAVQKYFDHPSCRVREESSRATVRSTVRLFQQDHPDLELHEVTERILEEWLGGKLQSGVADSTVQKYMQRLNAFLRWARRRGHIDQNPAEELKFILNLRPQPVREHNWLSRDEVQTILDSIEVLTSQDLRDAIVLRLGFTAGLRNNEIRGLPVAALGGIAKGRIVVRGKGRKLAEVSVSATTADLITDWLDLYEDPKPDSPVIVKFRNLRDWNTGERTLTPRWGEGVTQQTIGRIVAERSTAAGHPISPHDMRRAFAGIVYENSGENIFVTSQALRHSNVSTTQTYLEKKQDAAARAVESLDLGLR